MRSHTSPLEQHLAEALPDAAPSALIDLHPAGTPIGRLLNEPGLNQVTLDDPEQ